MSMHRRAFRLEGLLLPVASVVALAIAQTPAASASTLTNPLAFAPAHTYNPSSTNSSLGLNGVAVADVNGDSKPDIITADQSVGDVSVIPNGGTGSFAANYLVGGSPHGVAVGDVNGDSYPDIVSADGSKGAVSVLINNGDGTFADPVSYAAGSVPSSVSIVDLNGDGHPDIVAANNQGGSVSVLMNNGDGTFADATNYAVGASPNGLAVADFNGDGSPDIATANFGPANGDSTTISVLYSNGSGGFNPQVTFEAGDHPFGLAVGDFNGDSHPDLAVTDFPTAVTSGTDQVQVLLNNGLSGASAGFDAPSLVAALPNQNVGIPSAVAVADLNADSNEDIAVADGGTIYIYPGNGDGTFSSGVGVGSGLTNHLAVADMNGDGALDLVTTTSDFPTVASVNLHELPPVNQSLPSLDPNPVVNQGSFGDGGNWKSVVPPTIHWQIQSCDSSNTCTDIPGASSTGDIFFAPTADLVGDTLRVAVTASNDAGSSDLVYSDQTNPIPPPPVNTVRPTISGQVTVGHLISAGGDKWNMPVTRSYVWYLCPPDDTDPGDYTNQCTLFAFNRSMVLPGWLRDSFYAGWQVEAVVEGSSSSNGADFAATNLVPVLAIDPGSLRAGKVGKTYSATLSATGATAPYSWTLASGSLPPGLSLGPDGTISGAPTTAGRFPFTVKATDSGNPARTGTQAYAITVAMAITPPLLAKGSVGQQYQATLGAVGGTAPYTWAVASGSLPPGLSLGPDGTISGAPTTAGTYQFTVKVTDSSSRPLTATKVYSIKVT